MLAHHETLVLLGTGVTDGGSSLLASLGMRWAALRGSWRWNQLSSTAVDEPPG